MAVEKLNRQAVENVAGLAKLTLDDAQADMMTEQLDKIFDLVTTLAEVDTTNVEPTYSPIETQTVLREDVAVNANQTKALLANAPESEGNLIKVPTIIDEGAEN
ncbi:Asp-tRNA(Asn)/Glu-tRNA(Gln) amidotransferase subunit GatC [Weissella viridescens]|nr:Asp-tRNA(Asn)/Glu-tRNA(Gln) amidotransferase subunit GatC [Weissella viridescens]MBX4172135.1 Asp-tRNA(Asn)/Glu-tRNA(Gln) amidotransferase subunit GatC [Weissella viridescens]MCB6839758.1 Asp-tRNA(Asn)/Glu-tRNA(Gln) amidotransferase subunit GatC [Weissella viridescens]MCB6846490.1 Asp-tRNA(Asn)/Glu-tRNA(Gln) amidotransferase subunit GatC [Weissella viridescens]QOD86800.1 Asp-tRNA(Asn)/Glu-tRNA(Gln) amidotransferase subunit GatC [Weissella viridescens]